MVGDVFYMGRTNGSNLYSVDAGTGHAFIKVDNTSVVPYDQKRDSVSTPLLRAHPSVGLNVNSRSALRPKTLSTSGPCGSSMCTTSPGAAPCVVPLPPHRVRGIDAQNMPP